MVQTSKPSSSFTGRARRRTTSPLVKWGDRVSRVVITAGGIGTIAAVTLVCVFLAWVVLPLFHSPQAQPPVDAGDLPSDRRPVHVALDDYQLMAMAVDTTGRLDLIALHDQQIIATRQLGGDKTLTALSFTVTDGHFAMGFEDGTIQLGRMRFAIRFLDDSEVPAEIASLEIGQAAAFQEGVITRTPAGQLRLSTLEVTLDEPIAAESASPIVALNLTRGATGPVYISLNADGVLRLSTVRARRNLLTGKVTYTPRSALLPYEQIEDRGRPDFLKISGLGDNVYVAWRDGTCLRYATGNLDNPQLAERVDFTPDPGVELTALDFIIGRTTLLVGDSAGHVGAWFRIKPEDAITPDGALFVEAHRFPVGPAAVTNFAGSTRGRMAAVGFADGSVRLLQITTNQVLLELDAPVEAPVDALAISPKDDGLLAAVGDQAVLWRYDPKHPEATFDSIFGKIWYEGYPEPAHVWQSSSGTDDFEPKFGLMPLIFGTIKATVYSMLFGLPLALAAAIYTSEFLHPRTRARIKPVIEMMASLPSVVLGFLAALVFAPFVEKIIPATLMAVLCVPLAFLAGAYVWQLLPYRAFVWLSRDRFWFILFVGLPLGLGMSLVAGPWAEGLLFAGDLRLWLDGQVDTRLLGLNLGGLGGWLVLLLPICGAVVAVISARVVNPWLRARSAEWSRGRTAVVDAAKFLVMAVATMALALLVGAGLSLLGLDPRGESLFPPDVMSTYIQRNALVVGFVMGFAVIPIIYTIAEDALSAVPEHLRAASLGAGATPWQTAVRIIIPIAMSGLFSATMIGLGRAVGETMIVLMAAGNTPVMEWNIFNGFRTLSANIAVELPEAPVNGTHYRTLFLAALTLFAMTFLVNTVAEVVRLRFRKRAYQL